MGDDAGVVHDFLEGVGFLGRIAFLIFWIGHKDRDNAAADIQLGSSQANAAAEVHFFSHNWILGMLQELQHFFTQDDILVG